MLLEIPQFNLHSLLFGTHTNAETFKEMARATKRHGNFGLEVAFHPNMINHRDAKLLGTVCVAEQVPITALCVFFGKNDVDPLGVATMRGQAFDRLKRASEFASVIGQVTGITPMITGPWAYQIGKKYPRTDTTRDEVLGFIIEAESHLDKSFPAVQRALEVLRSAENAAIQGHVNLARVLDSVGPNTGVHIDTFHLQLWGEDGSPKGLFQRFGDKLFWFHVSGQDRRTPGSHQDERIDWKAWADALNANPIKPGLCFEGFGPAFRAAVPEIGNGFPTDLEPDQSISQTLQTLRAAGLKI